MLGHWRGFQVKEASPTTFEMGEFDAFFNETALTLTESNGNQTTFDVSTTQGDTFILTEDNGA